MRLTLVAPCATMELAAATLASHLRISLSEALGRFAEPPTLLATRVEAPAARRLSNILTAMGAQVRMDPDGYPGPDQPRFDLSVQPIEGGRLKLHAEGLAMWLPPQVLPVAARSVERIEAALAGLGGLVLEGLRETDVALVRRSLRRIAGLRLAVSNPEAARYDLLADHRAPFAVPQAISEALRRLGLAPCRLTGALAARLDRYTCDHVLARFPNAGLVKMNRDFQRFDLFLTGTNNISPRELADFLIARSDLPRHRLERMSAPLRIESGLTRESALAFQADYAALGLETCARLRLYYPVLCPLEDRVGP